MVVIFGFGHDKQEDLGEVALAVCPNCHNQVFLHQVRSSKSVRLYFVPVVPYGTEDYLVCPICSRGLQLSRAQLPHLPAMRSATASFRAGRLTEAQYRARAGQFWRRLGVSLTGPPGPAPAGPDRPAAPAAASTPAAPAASAAGPPPAGPAAAGAGMGWITQLAQLAQLHDQGVLSDADYRAAKRRLLHQ